MTEGQSAAVMKEHIDVLMLEDVPADAKLIEETLRLGNLHARVRRTDTRAGFERALTEHRPDVIVSDHGLPSFDSLSALTIAHEKCPDVPFVVVSGSKDGMVLEALKRGASDSVSKDELPLLVPRLRRAIEESEKEQERTHLKHELMEIEERLRLLQDGVKDFGMYVLDPAGRITWWNAGALVMHGMEEAELVGQPFWRLLKPLKGARARVTDWLEAAEAQEHLEEEDWSMRRDGSQFWGHFIFTACRNPSGLLRGFTVVMRDLTETRRAAEVSRQTHSRQEAMLELAKDAFVTMNEKGTLLDWNGAAEKIFGYTREQAVGGEFVGLIIPPAMREELRRHLLQYLASGGQERLIGRWYTMQRSDGGEFPVEFALAPLPGQKPPRFTGYVRDISVLKQTETALQESKARYHMVVENVTDYAIYMLDPQGNVSSWNAGAQRIEGYRAEEIVGRNFSVFFTPEDIEKGLPQKELARAVTMGRSESEAWSVRKDRTRFRSHWILTAVHEANQLKGFVRVAHDVTSQRKTEQALRESEERFRVAVEGVQDYAIYMLDEKGRVATYNIGATRLEGYQPEEIVGKPLHTFFTPEDVANGFPDQELNRARTQGKSQSEGWNVRKDGARFCSNWVLTAIRDSQGKLTGYSKVARDVTQLKQAQEKVARWNAELEQRVKNRTKELEVANNELEAFSYSVSHDLRAPLRHINAFVRLLEQDLGDKVTPKAKSHFDAVADSAKRMGQLVDDLLSFSRWARQDLIRVPVKLNALVREALQELQAEMVGRDIEWIIGELPMVRGDPTALRQVVINLLSNAIKYSASRARTRIEIGANATPEEFVCYVRDNGVGFDMKYANKLFGVFQRLHSAREFEGTGIGLAIVRRVIQRHGGRTWAEAEVNRGATFYFTLPNSSR